MRVSEIERTIILPLFQSLAALWISENQTKPLISLQTDVAPATGQRILTCYLFPQVSIDEA